MKLVVGGVDLVEFGKRFYRQFNRDDLAGLASELAYSFLFAIFPFFIFLAALSGFAVYWLHVPDPTAYVIQQLNRVLPPAAAAVFLPQIEYLITHQQPALLTIGAIGALWGATAGMKSIMKGVNRAYGVAETRSFWQSNLVAIGLTLLGSVFIVVAFALLVLGQSVGEEVARALGIEAAFDWLLLVFGWIVPLILVGVAMLVIYRFAPNLVLPFMEIVPGTVFFVIVWLIATYLFSLYVSNFANYNATYGAIGGVVVMLLWLYLTSLLLLVGAELNALLAGIRKPRAPQ